MTQPDVLVPLKAAAAVRAAALRYAGVDVDDTAAGKIARAVLECADDECRIRQALDADMWAQQDVRDSVRQHQRRALFIELADRGLLPVTWPREVIVHQPGHPPGCAMTTVELSVPVRRAIP
jgi:hypothetical protein